MQIALKTKDEIQKALETLGYEVSDNLQLSPFSVNRILVLVKGYYFGIYDLNTHTFVD